MSAVKWYGDQIAAAIRAEMTRRLTACAILVTNRAKHLLSVPGTAQALRKLTYFYGGRKRTANKKGKVYGAAVSAPGEPPRKQLGHLRRSVAWEIADLAARVGTSLRYGRWLELGTRLMAARPWLRRALQESTDQIRRILAKPMQF